MANQSKSNEKVNEVINTTAAAQDAPTAKNEQWAAASVIEAKTALSRAKGELARELQSPFAVCNALRNIAKDKGTAVAQVLQALEIKPRELSPRSFGRFCLQTDKGLAIGREVSEKQLARLRNAEAVDGFRADGTPTKYVVCELKPNAYISALYALARDKGITFSATVRYLLRARKQPKRQNSFKFEVLGYRPSGRFESAHTYNYSSARRCN